MNFKNPPAWVICVLFALTALLGCAGGGSSSSSIADDSTPDAAVYRLLAAWNQNETGIAGSNTGDATLEQETTSQNHYIRFKDMSGEEWLLHVDEIVYVGDSKARVYTSYRSLAADRGSLKITFFMFKDAGVWYLEDIEVTEVPVVVVTETGVKGIVSDKNTQLPVSGAVIELYNKQTGVLAGTTTTDTTGFYSITGIPADSYYMVIERAGYDPITISDITVG